MDSHGLLFNSCSPGIWLAKVNMSCSCHALCLLSRSWPRSSEQAWRAKISGMPLSRAFTPAAFLALSDTLSGGRGRGGGAIYSHFPEEKTEAYRNTVLYLSCTAKKWLSQNSNSGPWSLGTRGIFFPRWCCLEFSPTLFLEVPEWLWHSLGRVQQMYQSWVYPHRKLSAHSGLMVMASWLKAAPPVLAHPTSTSKAHVKNNKQWQEQRLCSQRDNILGKRFIFFFFFPDSLAVD